MKAEGNSKYCPRCDSTKTVDDFHKNKCTSDGLAGFCKECMAELLRKLKEDPKFRARANSYQKKWRKGRKTQLRAYKRKWSQSNRHKAAAHKKVLKALRNGELVKSPCEICGKLKVEAHHEDYTKPLEVRWLCRVHHMRVHYREGFASTYLPPVQAKGEQSS